MSDEEKPIAFPSEDLGIRRLAEPSRALRHGIEHRLDVRRRARDTFKMSPVAVCCSSASFVSLNSRTFSMAMTAWSAKVFSNSTWLCENKPTSRRARWRQWLLP